MSARSDDSDPREQVPLVGGGAGRGGAAAREASWGSDDEGEGDVEARLPSNGGTSDSGSGGDGAPGGAARGCALGLCGAARLLYLAELAAVTAVYMAVGPALILVNKHILSELGFPFPIAVSALGQLASWAVALLAFRLVRSHALANEALISWRFYLTNMAVVGAASAGALAFGQGVYLYLSGAPPPAARGEQAGRAEAPRLPTLARARLPLRARSFFCADP